MSNTNTTSNEIHISRKVDPEKLSKFDLSHYLTKLMWIEPFYSRLLRSMNKIETDKIPTAGVSVSVDKINLYYNKSFLASLKDVEIIGILKHECLHILYEHTTKRMKDEKLIWNYSTDLAINTLLKRHELPEGGLIPGKKLSPLTEENKKNMSDEQISKYEYISNFIYNLPPDKSAEYYYEKFMQNEKIKEYLQDKVIEVTIKENGEIDDHGEWANLPDDEKQLVKQKIEELIKDAYKECDSAKSWGSIPQSIIKDIQSMFSKEIPWNELLKRFIGFTQRNERTSSITKLNRKYPGVHSGIQKNYKPKVAVYIDESGSVDDQLLSKFFAEINSLATICDFTLYKFDTEVAEDTKVEFQKGKKYALQRQKVGGTDFDAPTIHANERRKLFDGLIIMTDGLAPKPVNSRLRRCWVLPNKSKLDFDSNNDIIINVK